MLNVDTYDLIAGLPFPGKQLDVTVTFDDGVPAFAQEIALLEFEKRLRQLTHADVRVFKHRMGDDSKLRIKMTPAEREKL